MAEDAGIVWHVDSHQEQERSADWYWGLGLLCLAGIGLSIFFGNYLLAIIIVLGGSSFVALTLMSPREHDIRLSSRGVSVDGTLYRWDNIESFWVEDERALPPGRQAHFIVSTKGVVHPQLVLPLIDTNRAQNVRAYAKRYAQEVEQEAHLGHHLVQLLGL